MKKSPFIWLGAGRAKKRGVARCGRQLDEVARAGLPVPEGAILLDELFRIFLQEGVVEQIGDRVAVPDPIWLLEVLYRDVRFPRLGTTADIRAIPPDDFDGRLPLDAITRGVNLEDADQVAGALRKAWSSLAREDDLRCDVLLMKQLMAEMTGRALLSRDGDAEEITVVSGGGEEMFYLPHVGRWQRPSPELPPYARRLQMLLRGVRRTLGKGDWGFDWVDDGEVCWIQLFN